MVKPTIYTFCDVFKERLSRFHAYLAESDSEGIIEYGYPTFSDLRKDITDLIDTTRKQKSGLVYRRAEVFADKLGDEITEYGKQIFETMKHEKFDSHHIQQLGCILALGRNIKYYNQC